MVQFSKTTNQLQTRTNFKDLAVLPDANTVLEFAVKLWLALLRDHNRKCIPKYEILNMLQFKNAKNCTLSVQKHVDH
jgi:hypothetical protein